MRRAFVMPVVILLALVASLTVTVVLNRNSVRTNGVENELRSYVQDHRQRGIREVISTWLQYTGRQSIEDIVTEDGLAFTLDFSGDRTLKVWLFESQTTALVNPSGLGPMQPDVSVISLTRQREIASATRLALQSMNPSYVASLGRQAGPLAVSAHSAPIEVIEALTMATIGDEAVAEAFARELVRLRDSGNEITRLGLLDLAREAGVSDDEQPKLTSLWTTRPTLWSVRAELTGPEGVIREKTLARYEALVFIPREDSTNALISGSEHSNSWYLEWNRLDDGVGYTPAGNANSNQGGRG
jgi:hypothetical protein